MSNHEYVVEKKLDLIVMLLQELRDLLRELKDNDGLAEPIDAAQD